MDDCDFHPFPNCFFLADNPTPATRSSPSPQGLVTSGTKAGPVAAKPSPSPRGSLTPEVAQGDGPLQTISERTALYRQALAEAESAGDGSKVRRYKRGLETLEEMMKSVKAKRAVNLEELPPVVIVKGSTSSSSAAQVIRKWGHGLGRYGGG